MNKKILIVLAVGLVGLGAWYFWKYQSPKAVEYSLEGQVMAINGINIAISTGAVEDGAFVRFERQVVLNPEVAILNGTKITKVKSGEVGTYLKERDRAVFYGTASSSPMTSDGILKVSKIQVTSRAATSTPVKFPKNI